MWNMGMNTENEHFASSEGGRPDFIGHGGEVSRLAQDSGLLSLLVGIWGDYDDEYFEWQQSLSNYYVLRVMLNVFCYFSQLNLTTSLWYRYVLLIFLFYR